MKRLKNIEGKKKDQLDAIKDQGEKQLDVGKDQGKKQLDAIGKQKENKPKIIEKELYPNFFTSQGKNSLKTLAKNENRIDYKNLSYKILFTNDRFHVIKFLKLVGKSSN